MECLGSCSQAKLNIYLHIFHLTKDNSFFSCLGRSWTRVAKESDQIQVTKNSLSNIKHNENWITLALQIQEKDYAHE